MRSGGSRRHGRDLRVMLAMFATRRLTLGRIQILPGDLANRLRQAQSSSKSVVIRLLKTDDAGASACRRDRDVAESYSRQETATD